MQAFKFNRPDSPALRRMMMSHCILLDGRQKAGYHVLSYAGTLAECRGVAHDPGTSWSLPTSQWIKTHVEDKSLIGPFGHTFDGEIATLEQIISPGAQP